MNENKRDFINIFMYDRQKALEYAREWWNKRNPKFYNFQYLGGDCTSFVSQCLFYGGVKMNYGKNGWFYSSLNSRSPSWSGVEEFCSFSITNYSQLGVKTREVGRYELTVGDVVQLNQKGRFNHTLLVTSVGENGKIYVACHDNDAFDKDLDSYFFKRIRFLKVLN